MPKITGSRCPVCQSDLDAASSLQDEEARPAPGNLSVCLYCGIRLVFTDDLSLRLLTAREERSLTPEVRRELGSLVMAINNFMGSRN